MNQSLGKLMLGVSEAPLMMGWMVRGFGAYFGACVVCDVVLLLLVLVFISLQGVCTDVHKKKD